MSISAIRSRVRNARENRVEERNQPINSGIIIGLVIIIQPRSPLWVEAVLEDDVNYCTNNSHERHKSEIEPSAEILVRKKTEIVYYVHLRIHLPFHPTPLTRGVARI